MQTETIVPLDVMSAGTLGHVEEVAGAPDWVGRMAELGIRSGTRIYIVRQGSPCLVDVGGSRLSVRFDAASFILVRPASGWSEY